MNQISFITANYVARQLDYNMTGGWGQGDRASNEFFRPLETFKERFSSMLDEIAGLGFEAIDLWTAQLNPTWATAQHIAIAREALAQHHFPVASLGGGFGSTPDEFEGICRLAVALDCQILAGTTAMLQKDRNFTITTLRNYNLRLGVENHPEKNPAEVLAKIGDGAQGTLGVTVDTGWFGTQGYDAAQALEELAGVLFHVHLKDVLQAGAHNTCGYGKGVVPLERCVHTLQRIGYTGGISIEHEPDHYNPDADCAAALVQLKKWLTEGIQHG